MILDWDEPAKVRSTEEHNAIHVADSAPPGVFVPNMSVEAMRRWKAKRVGGDDSRVEIRKTASGRSNTYGQMLLVVRPDGTVQVSIAGKAEVRVRDLIEALSEAEEALR